MPRAKLNKPTRYKGFVIQEFVSDITNEIEFKVYTKDEWEMGAGNRYEEIEAQSIEEAKQFIDSYGDHE